MNRKRRRRIGALAALTLAPLLALAVCWQIVASAGRGRCFSDPVAAPKTEVALVLGTSPTSWGRTNLYYARRIEAAIALWRAKKVERFLVSGNGSPESAETQAMRRDLVAAGVPGDRIMADDRGLRTQASMVRAQRVFGLRRVLIVSQRFHNERALYLADRIGLDAVACDAEAVDEPVFSLFRESLARVKAVLEGSGRGRE